MTAFIEYAAAFLAEDRPDLVLNGRLMWLYSSDIGLLLEVEETFQL